MKVVKIVDDGFVWHVPLEVIAKHRAEYYAAKDEDTTFDDEFDYVMDDEYEVVDWLIYNMDFDEVASSAKLVSTPKPKSQPDMNLASCDIIDLPECATK